MYTLEPKHCLYLELLQEAVRFLFRFSLSFLQVSPSHFLKLPLLQEEKDIQKEIILEEN